MSFRTSANAIIECVRQSPADVIAKEVESTYPDITLEDAQRIRDGLVATLTASTQRDKEKLKEEYIALHAELSKKYKR